MTQTRNLVADQSKLIGLFFATAIGLLLASCSETQQAGRGFSPSEYGVSASQRVVAMGEPVPRGGGIYRVGKPYQVRGLWYYPQDKPGYTAAGVASWYGDDFHGRKTANGEIYNMYALSAAHPTLPMPSYARVTNTKNGRSVVVRINDRGPYHSNRVIDLSKRAALLLGTHSGGLGKVRVDYIGKAPLHGNDDKWLTAQVKQNGRTLTKQEVASIAPVPVWASIEPGDQANPVRVALADVLPEQRAIAQAEAQVPNSSYAVASLNNVAAPADDERIGLEAVQNSGTALAYAEPEKKWPYAQPAEITETSAIPPGATQIVRVGSFSDPAQATRYRDNLMKFGSASIQMEKISGVTLYQVNVGPFNDEAAAQKALNQARSQGATGAQLFRM
ncbi:MAG: septal ring lytic transglycosylase RlpA family protein [Pseudomonadota bacterium]